MARFNQIPNHKIWHMLTEPKLPPPSCAQNVLSLLRRATGTDKKGNQPSFEAEVFLKNKTVNQNRGIYVFANLDQSSLKIRSIIQKINSGEYLNTLHHHTAHHHTTTAFTWAFTI